MKRRNLTRPEQHLANLCTWCKHYGAPDPVLLQPEARYRSAREDRCLIVASPAWQTWLADQCLLPDGAVQPYNAAIAAHTPFSVVGRSRPTAVQGWRGRRTLGAVQFILHQVHLGEEVINALECDFDHANPADGLLGAALHGVESLYYRWKMPFGGKQIRTDPEKIAQRLDKLKPGGAA